MSGSRHLPKPGFRLLTQFLEISTTLNLWLEDLEPLMIILKLFFFFLSCNFNVFCIANPCWFLILNIATLACQSQTPNLFPLVSQYFITGFLDGSVGKESASSAGNTGDAGSIPRSRRSLGGGNGNPLHYSYLKTPKDSGAGRAKVHRVTKSQTRLSD